MTLYSQEFKNLAYVISKSEDILLFAHSRPDGDAAGAVLAFKEYLISIGKKVDIACFDPFPKFLAPIVQAEFLSVENLDLKKYKLFIACDSVERGFEKIFPQLSEDQVVALLDHHPYITLQGDINVIDTEFSSACEIVYDFFEFQKVPINKKIATLLLLGILYDTGKFQHSNTTPRVLEISSQLIKKGAEINKITTTLFSSKSLSALRLWGRAFERAKINSETGLISSYLTQKDFEEFQADNDDIAYIAGLLNMVPNTKFSLILSERENGKLKGSLRSDEHKNTDVSLIAQQFGGGGHKLASGFEIEGRIVETEDGWEIV